MMILLTPPLSEALCVGLMPQIVRRGIFDYGEASKDRCRSIRISQVREREAFITQMLRAYWKQRKCLSGMRVSSAVFVVSIGNTDVSLDTQLQATCAQQANNMRAPLRV